MNTVRSEAVDATWLTDIPNKISRDPKSSQVTKDQWLA